MTKQAGMNVSVFIPYIPVSFCPLPLCSLTILHRLFSTLHAPSQVRCFDTCSFFSLESFVLIHHWFKCLQLLGANLNLFLRQVFITILLPEYIGYSHGLLSLLPLFLLFIIVTPVINVHFSSLLHFNLRL